MAQSTSAKSRESVYISSSFKPERNSENDLGYLKLRNNRIADQHPAHLSHGS
jgi:hypothetical protein